MAGLQGHVSGHHGAPPEGFDWGRYVELLLTEHGGWSGLADAVMRMGASVESSVPTDRQTIERGLRRLASRGNLPGGQYGRWMLRLFGVPNAVSDWARWLGQYHRRFHDLPTSLRHDQLRQWDRPPVSESSSAVWIHVALAGVFHRCGDLDAMARRLQLARACAKRAGPAAEIEVSLFSARHESDAGQSDQADRWLDDADRVLAQGDAIEADDRDCYLARILDQRAYRRARGADANVVAAQELYERIPPGSALPFVRFRRDVGLAYCAWKLGDAPRAAVLARAASEHAGDGGFVRFRVMALNLLARIVAEPERAVLEARAVAMARALEDEDLLVRLRRPSSALGTST